MSRPLERSAGISAAAPPLLPGGVSSSLRALDPPRVFVRAQGSPGVGCRRQRVPRLPLRLRPIILGHADDRVARARRWPRSPTWTSSAHSAPPSSSSRSPEAPAATSRRRSGSCSPTAARRRPSTRSACHAPPPAGGCWSSSRAATTAGTTTSRANVISQPRARRHDRPHLRGRCCRRRSSGWRCCPSTTSTRSSRSWRAHGDDVAAVILEPVIHTIGCVVRPRPSSWRRCGATTSQTRARCSSSTRSSPGSVTTSAATRRSAASGPTSPRSPRRWPTAIRSPWCAAGPTSWSGSTPRPAATSCSAAPTTATRLSVAAALATIEALEADDRADPPPAVRAGRADARRAPGRSCDRLGITARAASFGSVFVLYFTDRDVRSFDDALTNDAELYVGFHRGMIERGFLMPPMNLKRNHLTAAHTRRRRRPDAGGGRGRPDGARRTAVPARVGTAARGGGRMTGRRRPRGRAHGDRSSTRSGGRDWSYRIEQADPRAARGPARGAADATRPPTRRSPTPTW